MAYEKDSNKGSNNTAAPGTNQGGNYVKASGFLNLSIVGKDGSKKKLGAIPLYKHKHAEAQLMEWLQPVGADEAETVTLRAARVQALLNALTCDFVPVSDEPKGFDLPM
jgi:hypothetical protein